MKRRPDFWGVHFLAMTPWAQFGGPWLHWGVPKDVFCTLWDVPKAFFDAITDICTDFPIPLYGQTFGVDLEKFRFPIKMA